MDETAALLKIIPVKVEGPNGTEETFALLDDGSTITVIDAGLSKRLGLHGAKSNIRIRGIRQSDVADACYEKVEFYIQGDENEFLIKNAVAVANLTFPSQSLPAGLVRRIAKV